MTRPLHEHLYRKVLNDPDASNDERLRAARALERIAQGRRRIQKQAAAEVAAEPQPQPETGWRTDWTTSDPGLRTDADRERFRLVVAMEVANGAAEPDLAQYGGPLSQWEKAQGKESAEPFWCCTDHKGDYRADCFDCVRDRDLIAYAARHPATEYEQRYRCMKEIAYAHIY